MSVALFIVHGTSYIQHSTFKFGLEPPKRMDDFDYVGYIVCNKCYVVYYAWKLARIHFRESFAHSLRNNKCDVRIEEVYLINDF